MTEAELAADPREPGRVIRHRGRYWRETFRGLFEPIHPMARLSIAEATRPSALCWGYHATLADPESANASKPMHLLADLEGYGPDVLSANRRYHLRRSQRQVEVVQVLDLRPFEDEAYAVFRSAQARTNNPFRATRSKSEFLAEMAWFTARPSAIVVAGLLDGRLGGWIAGFAVDGTAYIEIVDIATEVLSSHISTGLHFAFAEVCRRSGGIHEIAHSPHIPEDAALATFKEGIGFPVVSVPSMFWMAPAADTLVRWRKPFLHYRLTGRLSPRAERGRVASPATDRLGSSRQAAAHRQLDGERGPGRAAHGDGVHDPPPGRELVTTIREPGLVLEQRVLVTADPSPEVKHPRPGLVGPPARGVVDEPARRQGGERLPGATQVRLHDAAAQGEQPGRSDPPVHERNEQVQDGPQFGDHPAEVRRIEVVRGRGSEPLHGLAVQVDPFPEVVEVKVVHARDAGVVGAPDQPPRALVVATPLLLGGQGQVDRDRGADVAGLAQARDQVLLREQRVQAGEDRHHPPSDELVPEGRLEALDD